MSSADLITCSCKSCNTLLCVSTNKWTEITSSYATYDVVQMFSHPGLEQSGPTRPGSKDSELDGCTVQPLHCRTCKDSIGVKCVSVGPEKEMHRDRCFLKLGKLVMKDLAGNSVEADIKTKEGSKSDSRASGHAKRQTRATQETNGRNSARGRSNSEEVENEELQQQNDTKQIVQRQEGDIIKILQNLKALTKEMRDFQDEMASLKADVDGIRVRQESGNGQEAAEDIEMLTESVSNVSSRLGELDSLKLEVKMMHSRIKRLEDDKRGSSKIIGPPLTPRSTINGSKSIPSFDSALNKRTGSSNLKPNHTASGPEFENIINRSRAASVQLDYTRPSAIPTGPKPFRAASVQGDHTRSNPIRSDMPPPAIPNRAVTELRSASDTPRNSQTQSNLQNAISTLNDSANEFPSAVEDSDDEYNDQAPSPDPDDTDYRPRRARQSLPNPATSDDIDPQLTPKPQKRRRTTASHAINRDNPSPNPDDPAYQSVWAPTPTETQRNSGPIFHQRNEHGLIIKPNGQIDKRSLRFLGKSKSKRRLVAKDAVRDLEGYLLNPDGSRNERSVSIIDGMRKREREESEVPEQS